MRIASLALILALSPIPFGCGGDGGSDDSVSRQRVFPSTGFTGRQLRVEISGDDTDWKAGATVDFGPGVTVQSVTVEGPTVMFADITIAHDVAPGMRDVLITSGSDKLTLKEGFLIESPISVKFRGTFAQGSVATFAIHNHDYDKPFDTTSEGDGFFEPLTFPNIMLEAPAGIDLSIDSVTDYAITGIALINVDAAAGPLVVHSGLDADLVMSRLGGNFEVQARTPTPLTSGMKVTGMVTESLASTLYEFAPTSGALVLHKYTATTANQDATPRVILLGPSGTFDEVLGFSGAVIQITDAVPAKVYPIFWDNTGVSGYEYELMAASHSLTAVAAEAEPTNNAAAGAATLVQPAFVRTAELSAATDADWFAIDVAAGDIGKKIHVYTTGMNTRTDTYVEVFSDAGTTSFGGPSSDLGYHEYHQTPAVTAAGKYWVKVSASPEYNPANKPYSVAIWTE